MVVLAGGALVMVLDGVAVGEIGVDLFFWVLLRLCLWGQYGGCVLWLTP